MKWAVRLWKNESGASSAEYALLVGIIGTGIALAAIGLGDAVANSIGNTAECIDSRDACPR